MASRFLSGENPKAFEVTAPSLRELFINAHDLVDAFSSPCEPTLLALDFAVEFDSDELEEYRATLVFSGANDDEVGEL
jgi:hypothetical protein